jgi:hypothetical protein
MRLGTGASLSKTNKSLTVTIIILKQLPVALHEMIDDFNDKTKT